MKKMLDRPKRKTRHPERNGQVGQPTWDIAWLYPEQGNWSEEEYLDLPGNRLIEFSDGFLEFPPMPTTSHQWIGVFLLEALKAFTWPDLGWVLPAPLRVRLRPRKYREPDLVFMLKAHRKRVHEKFWEAADLVMEILSGKASDRRRDLKTKRVEYARAGIAEYWIIDPRKKRITVLCLQGKTYEVHGVFKAGQRATSKLLAGFAVKVDDVFAPGI